MPQIDLWYVVWSWSGSFGYAKLGGLGPALAMVPTVENFCHVIETRDIYTMQKIIKLSVKSCVSPNKQTSNEVSWAFVPLVSRLHHERNHKQIIG